MERDDAGAERVRRRMSRWAGAGSLVLGAALLVAGLNARAGTSVATGRPLPAFDLALLEGGRATSADLDGRVTVINFWASWCPPCRAEAPVLRRVYEASNPDDVAFLGVSRDDDVSAAREFVERFDPGYPNAIDATAFARAVGIPGLPTTIVVDRHGFIAATHFGPLTESRLRALIDDARNRKPPETDDGPDS